MASAVLNRGLGGAVALFGLCALIGVIVGQASRRALETTSSPSPGARRKTTSPLKTYLNDHLAGSVAALALLERIINNPELVSQQAQLISLRGEIRSDQRTLEQIMARVGVETSAVRRAGGWLAEKASALKLLVDDPVDQAMGRLEAFELLGLGITGKRALWQALEAVQDREPALRAFDFTGLTQRADNQRARVEAMRLAAMRELVTR